MPNPEDRPVSVGIVGCGAVTELYYAPALRVLEREGVVQVSALFDPDAECVARIGAKFPAASRERNFDDVLQGEATLIVIASPPAYHAEQVIRSVQSGKAVLCEKPLATTLADGYRIVDAAQKTGSILAVGLVRRLFPATQIIKSVLATHMLGTLRAFQCFEGGTFQWPARSRTYFDRTVTGGGVLQDIRPHIFDLLSWWFGSPTVAKYQDNSMGGVEANCRIRLEYTNFAGDIQLSRDWNRPNRFLFQGAHAWLAWDPNETDRVDIGFPENKIMASASLYDFGFDKPGELLGRPSRNFHQSFVQQNSKRGSRDLR